MTYKPGDKFIVEIERVSDPDAGHYVMTTGWLYGESTLDKLPQLIDGVDTASYNKGLEDAWAMAQRIHRMNGGDVEDVFMPQGAQFYHDAETAIRKHTVYEAKEKLEAWDNKICIGDEVKSNNPIFKSGIVIEIADDSNIWLLTVDGVALNRTKNYSKTGNNYAAELRELLNKIGGESE